MLSSLASFLVFGAQAQETTPEDRENRNPLLERPVVPLTGIGPAVRPQIRRDVLRRPDLTLMDQVPSAPAGVTADYLNFMANDYQRQARDFARPPKDIMADIKGSPEPDKPNDPNPPAGALAHEQDGPDVMKEVRVEPQRRKLSEPKRLGEAEGGGILPAPEWRKIGFSSGEKSVRSGIDPALLRVSDSQLGRDYTFAMILLNEYLTPEIEARLNQLGVELLDRHSSAHKAKVPVGAARLQRIIDEPFVEWMGYPDRQQKLSSGLSQALEKFSQEVEKYPVFINFFHEFEASEAEQFIADLRRQDIFQVKYHEDIGALQATIPALALKTLLDKDYVLFIELDEPQSIGHDQSTPTIGADYIRPGGSGTRFSGAPVIVGILDTGFMVGSGAATPHVDLNKYGCGRNFTSDAAGVWNDQNDHGTHVLGSIGGAGIGQSRYRGVATGIGSSANKRIRAAKIYDSSGNGGSSWTNNGLEYMRGNRCDSARPHIMNLSGGGGTNMGTDAPSRRVDANSWDHEILSVIIAHNDGPGASTARSPGNAKTALTVGNVRDVGYPTVGDINSSSGRGPTGDDRMKPNVVAVGTSVMAPNAGTASGYRSMTGTSMAGPHVSGVAATLMHHYDWLRRRPYYIRAHMMATALLHDDDVTPRDNDTNGRNTYGLGRVSSYVSNWAHGGPNGWSSHLARGTVSKSTWRYRDIEVPQGTDRLVVVMTWDEDAASSGASQAVKYDLDLWVDRGADCTGDGGRQCGEWNSISYEDNVEYVIIDNPPSGTYRLKMVNWDAPRSGVPAGLSATVIRGDTSPAMSTAIVVPSASVSTGSTFSVTTTVSNPDYIASGVHLENTFRASGVSFVSVSTIREDGTSTSMTSPEVTLGDIRAGDSRTAVWTFRKTSSGSKQIRFRTWSENAGEQTRTITVN